MGISVEAEPKDEDSANRVVYRLLDSKTKQMVDYDDAASVRELITTGKGAYAGVTIYHSDGKKVTNTIPYPSVTEGGTATTLKQGWINHELSMFSELELKMATDDSELRAVQQIYNDENYDVSYHNETGAVTKTVEYHGKNPVLLPNLSKNDWIFRGWSKKANTTTVDYKGGQAVNGLAPGKSVIDLYPVFYQPTDFNFVVDTSDFKVLVYDKESGQLWKTFDCTIGERGNDTPLGEFEIQRKYLYDYMPLAKQDVWYTSYFTSTGVAFHAAPWRYYYGEWHLGQRASHGCINMRTEDAQWIYEHCKIGDSVIVK
jgi:lipoprotein-anchoring transpeptidase ErfK/SrfK